MSDGFESLYVAINEKINHEIISAEVIQPEQKKLGLQNITRILNQQYLDTDTLFSIIRYKDLHLYNVNTNEELEVVFWKNGEFVPAALDKLDQFMRDWRRDEVIDIDPQLYLLLHKIYEGVDADHRIHLISGHRSKKTNDNLRSIGRKTAKKSQHVLGRAADIYIPEITVKELREKALEMKEGGVGYYPKDGFVHIDTGKVRQW